MKLRKKLLSVYMEGSEFEEPKIQWEFGERVNAYFLIGVLEDIKQVLIDTIDEEGDG